MNRHLLLLLVVLFPVTLLAQPNKFYIGAFYVGGNVWGNESWNDTLHMQSPGPVRNLISVVNAQADHQWELPISRFEELQDMGINIAGIEIDSSAVMRCYNTNGMNVFKDINDVLNTPAQHHTNNQDIDLCAFEWGIHDLSCMNRIMLHPESPHDFLNANYTKVHDDLMESLIYRRSYLDQSLYNVGPGNPNCVIITDNNIISGIDQLRKREFNVMRDYLGGDNSKNAELGNVSSGIYHLSIIMRVDPDNPVHPLNNAETVLTVRVRGRSRTAENSISESVFTIPGSTFYDKTSHALRAEPFEHRVGRIELRYDSITFTPTSTWIPLPYVVTVNDTAAPRHWINNRLTDEELANIQWRGGFLGEGLHLDASQDMRLNHAMDTFDIQLIANLGSASLLIDAICLSRPSAYELFSDTSCYAGPYGNNRKYLRDRISYIASDGAGTTNNQSYVNSQRLKLLVNQESLPSDGRWCMGRLISAMINDSMPNVKLYTAHGAEMSYVDLQAVTELDKAQVSGFYAYSVDKNAPRMNDSPPPSPSRYYDSLYTKREYPSSTSGRMRLHTLLFRQYAQERKNHNNTSPWIPYIQNHSNAYDIDDNGWFDHDFLREPSAAEMRLMCNIALAHGADGIMYYMYNMAGGWHIDKDSACWPKLRSNWINDPSRPMNGNCGSMGFLGANNMKRHCDMNGEDKWDSTSYFNKHVLMPLGEKCMNLTWESSRSWYSNEGDSSRFISKVISQRQDAQDPIDRSYLTYVETSDFSSGGNNYIFVINGRSHTEGQRHITVKLKPQPNIKQWKVENVLTGDVWLVKPTTYPDSTTTSNGFTDYLSQGSGYLYKIEANDEALDFNDTCFTHTVTIEPEAKWAIKSGSEVELGNNAMIIVEGVLFVSGSTIRCCNNEGSTSIILRNLSYPDETEFHGSILDNVRIVAGSGIIVVSDSTSYSNHGAIVNEPVIYLNHAVYDSHYSTCSVTGYGSYVTAYNSSVLSFCDSVFGTGIQGQAGIIVHGGYTMMNHSKLLDLQCGLLADDNSEVFSYEYPWQYGRNKIRVKDLGLYADCATIDFGQPGDYAGIENSITITDPSIVYDPHLGLPAHAYAEGPDEATQIFMDQNYWGIVNKGNQIPVHPLVFNQSPLWLFYTWNDTLSVDPVPFARTSQGESIVADDGGSNAPPQNQQYMAQSPSVPPNFRAYIKQQYRNGNLSGVRSTIGTFLSSSNASSSSLKDLRFIFSVGRKLGDTQILGALFGVCMGNQSLHAKLLASDIATHAKDYASALSVLNSYSFAGSSSLLASAMKRKAMLYPLEAQGGYVRGLLAIDTLKTLYSSDSTLRIFVENYPKLYSGLNHITSATLPKIVRSNFEDLLHPSTMELSQNYPNPFKGITSITFKLTSPTQLSIKIFDLLGREVLSAADGYFGEGTHSVVVRGESLPSGVYIYKMITGSGVKQRTMLHTK
jgi:hypothetical protein